MSGQHTEPGSDVPEQDAWLGRALLRSGPLFVAAVAVWVLLEVSGGLPWTEVVPVLLVSAVAGAVLVRTLAGLRSAVPVFAAGLMVGLVVVGGVLDRDAWLGLFVVGYLAGGLLVPVDEERREARRRA